jgi:hypothetical protein
MERYLKKDLDLLIFEINYVFKNIPEFKKCKNEDAEEIRCFLLFCYCDLFSHYNIRKRNIKI